MSADSEKTKLELLCELAKLQIPSISADPERSIGRLPSTIPTYTAVENLDNLYKYTDEEAENYIAWSAHIYKFSELEDGKPVVEETNEALCGEAANNPEQIFVSWYQTAKNLETDARLNVWIKEVVKGSELAHPPAMPTAEPPTPSPLPTFVPKISPSLRLDPSLSLVLRSRPNGLGVNPPTGRCLSESVDDEDEKYAEYSWSEMKYDVLKDKMVWIPADTIWCRVNSRVDKHKLLSISVYTDNKNTDLYDAELPESSAKYDGSRMLGVVVCEAEDLSDKDEFPNLGEQLSGYRVLVKTAGMVYILCSQSEGSAEYGHICSDGSVKLDDSSPEDEELYFKSPTYLSHTCTDGNVLTVIKTTLPAQVYRSEGPILVKITEVPPIGYGAGIGYTIKGFDPLGKPILSEESVPVWIPSI